jgi:serine/threonine-protein kinase
VVLWELITGARLFKGPTEAAMLHATLRSPIPYPAAYRSDVPPAIEQVVLRALERDRSRRYGAALEMKEDLERWLDDQGRGFCASLAAFMGQAFASERDEQQNFVRELLAQQALTLTSSGTMARLSPPNMAGRTQATDLAELVQHRTQTNQLLLVLQRKNQVVTWTLAGLLALLVGILTGVAVVVLRPPAAAQKIEVQAHTPAPALPRVVPEVQAPLPPALAQNSLDPAPAARPFTGVARTPQPPPPLARISERAPPKASGADAKPAEPGFLTLDTSPWSVVSAGGHVLGTTPLVRVALPAGDVVLSLSNPDTGAHATYALRIEAGKTVSRRIGLE